MHNAAATLLRKSPSRLNERTFGQLPTRTIPHRTGIGPDEWLYSVVVVLVGSCPGGGGGIVLGIVVPVGNGWALFFIRWGIVLGGSCPRTINESRVKCYLLQQSQSQLSWKLYRDVNRVMCQFRCQVCSVSCNSGGSGGGGRNRRARP